MTMSETELAHLASPLVAIDSVNPALVPGGAGEREIASFVAGWLDRAGLTVETVASPPGRPSVIGIATAVLGPGGEGEHAEVEWVDLGDIGACAEIYLEVARRMCAPETRP